MRPAGALQAWPTLENYVPTGDLHTQRFTHYSFNHRTERDTQSASLSSIAQLAEHSTVNRRVTGSSPVGGAEGETTWKQVVSLFQADSGSKQWRFRTLPHRTSCNSAYERYRVPCDLNLSFRNYPPQTQLSCTARRAFLPESIQAP